MNNVPFLEWKMREHALYREEHSPKSEADNGNCETPSAGFKAKGSHLQDGKQFMLP